MCRLIDLTGKTFGDWVLLLKKWIRGCSRNCKEVDNGA